MKSEIYLSNFPQDEYEDILNFREKMNQQGSFTSHFTSPIRCVNCSDKIKDPTHKCKNIFSYIGKNSSLNEQDGLQLSYAEVINMNVLANADKVVIIDYITNKKIDILQNLDYYELLVNGKIILVDEYQDVEIEDYEDSFDYPSEFNSDSSMIYSDTETDFENY